ncbi:MAG: hypothetical protein KF763_11295 [Cyclobacteriaceae bacterium]|nr:hypothetical protein [Cyclobacteriaceae bacterium]
MPAHINFFAPSERVPEAVRPAVYVTNILSWIFTLLTAVLFGILYSFFGWTRSSSFIIGVGLIFLLIPFINRRFHNAGRLLFCLVPVYVAFSISVYGKIMAPEHSYITYFDIRYIVLATTILPAITFLIEEKWKLTFCMGSTLLCLIFFDPIHNVFGLGYFQRGFTALSYYYINYITIISFLVLAFGVLVLKVITGRAEVRVKKTIDQLNATNKLLMTKNEELMQLNESMAQQSEELIRQKKEIHESRELISEANLLINQQQERLLESNKSLEKLVAQKTSDLSATNEELIRHNNELRQFSYTVSHNLRAPVARLLGLTDLFHKPEMEQERTGIAGLIYKAGKDLDEILKDLHQIIDLRNDLYQVREKISFEDEWQKTRFVLQEQLRPGYQIQTNFEQAPIIYSIRAMIQSILYNLVSNAIKYRNPENDLKIEVTTYTLADQTVILEVKDNGLGINLQTQKENIFKLYRRFHSHVDGKGLGLYLVKTQVETLGGSIALESEVNRGTTFRVSFPYPQNLTKQIIFENDAVSIYFDAGINNTVILWQRGVSPDEFRKAYHQVLSSLKTYHSPGCIVDFTRQGVLPEAEQHWLITTVIPEAVRNGLKRIGGIGLTDPVRKNYFELILAKANGLGVELRLFSNIDEAKAWMNLFIQNR